MRGRPTDALRQPRRVGVGGGRWEGAGAHGRPDKCMRGRPRPCAQQRVSPGGTVGARVVCGCRTPPPASPERCTAHTRASAVSPVGPPQSVGWQLYARAPPAPPFSSPPLRWSQKSTAGCDLCRRGTHSAFRWAGGSRTPTGLNQARTLLGCRGPKPPVGPHGRTVERVCAGG